MKTAFFVIAGLLVGVFVGGFATGCDGMCWAPQLPRTQTIYGDYNGGPDLLVLDLEHGTAQSERVTADGHHRQIQYKIAGAPVLSDDPPF